jgi:hypothetical protein
MADRTAHDTRWDSDGSSDITPNLGSAILHKIAIEILCVRPYTYIGVMSADFCSAVGKIPGWVVIDRIAICSTPVRFYAIRPRCTIAAEDLAECLIEEAVTITR